jgi:hypothetical protein
MGKGLPRSLSRGAAGRQEVFRIDIEVPADSFVITDPGAAIGWGTLRLAGLPEGNLLFLGAVLSNLEFTKGDADIIDAFNGDFALGTAPTADNVLAGTEVDLIASTAMAVGVSGVSAGNRGISTATEHGLILDNTAGTMEVNLNVLVDDISISADSSFTLRGSLHMAMVVLGDD